MQILSTLLARYRDTRFVKKIPHQQIPTSFAARGRQIFLFMAPNTGKK